MAQIWKIIRRLFVGIGVLMGLLMLIVAGIIVFDAVFGASSVENTNTTFTDAAGNELSGYLARPEGEGPFPAILLIHEWWGLSAGIPVIADALAEEGYLVFAADAYRGRLTDMVPRALYMRLSTPEEQIFDDLDAAFEYLLSLEDVDPGQVASMGFCFGGEHSLQLSLRQAERIGATIVYYGSLETDPEVLRPLTAVPAVLGIFGAEDQQIPVAEVRAFETALNSLDIENQVTIYPDVGHAFLTEENFDQPGPAGDAWQETLTFLAEQFPQGGN